MGSMRREKGCLFLLCLSLKRYGCWNVLPNSRSAVMSLIARMLLPWRLRVRCFIVFAMMKTMSSMKHANVPCFMQIYNFFLISPNKTAFFSEKYLIIDIIQKKTPLVVV